MHVSQFMHPAGLANMTEILVAGADPLKARYSRWKAVTDRSVASAPTCNASGIKCP